MSKRPYFAEYTKRFYSDILLLRQQGKDIRKLEIVVALLIRGKALREKYRDHALTGNLEGFRDLHIENDWLLIYRYTGRHTIRFERTGSHSQVFDTQAESPTASSTTPNDTLP
jgi:mRNA interferase YafQ